MQFCDGAKNQNNSFFSLFVFVLVLKLSLCEEDLITDIYLGSTSFPIQHCTDRMFQ